MSSRPAWATRARTTQLEALSQKDKKRKKKKKKEKKERKEKKVLRNFDKIYPPKPKQDCDSPTTKDCL